MTEQDHENGKNIGNFQRRSSVLDQERRQAMSELGEVGAGTDMDRWSEIERTTRNGESPKKEKSESRELGPGGKAILGFALNRDEEPAERDDSLAIEDENVRRAWEAGRQKDDPTMFPKELRDELRNKTPSQSESNESVPSPKKMTYEDRLQDIGLSVKEAQQLVDDLLTKGYVEKTYPVTHNRSVTFRSRDADDMRRALDEIEDYNPKFAPTSSHILSMNTLAASLVNLAGTDLSTHSVEAKKDVLRKLPEVTLRLLTSKLNQFDNMLLTVMDEEAIVNF